MQSSAQLVLTVLAGRCWVNALFGSTFFSALNLSQRALIAAGFLEYEQERAETRQIAAQNNNAGRAVPENFPELEATGEARDKAGERMHVSGRSVTDAKSIMDKVTPARFTLFG